MASLTTILVTLSILVPFSSTTVVNLLKARQDSTYTCIGDYTYTPGPGYHCDYAATLKAGADPISNTTVSTFDDCVKSCRMDRSCISFGFLNTTSNCLTYDVTVDAQKPKSGSSDTMYWNHHCFHPTQLSSSPLANSDFSTGVLDPWVLGNTTDAGSTVSAEIVSPGSNDNPYAAQLDCGEAAGYTNAAQVTLTQTFPCCATSKYTLSFNIYQVPGVTTDDGANQPFIQIYLITPNGHIQNIAAYLAGPTFLVSYPGAVFYTSGTWYSFSGNARSHQTGTCSYQVQISAPPNTTTSIQFDQLVVTEVPSESAV